MEPPCSAHKSNLVHWEKKYKIWTKYYFGGKILQLN